MVLGAPREIIGAGLCGHLEKSSGRASRNGRGTETGAKKEFARGAPREISGRGQAPQEFLRGAPREILGAGAGPGAPREIRRGGVFCGRLVDENFLGALEKSSGRGPGRPQKQKKIPKGAPRGILGETGASRISLGRAWRKSRGGAKRASRNPRGGVFGRRLEEFLGARLEKSSGRVQLGSP